MSKDFVIWLTIGVYALVMIGFGAFNARKAKSTSNFTVGNRAASGWMSALSYGAAYFSAVMFIGYSGKTGWTYGLWAILCGIGNAIFGSWLAWLVLAKRTREVSHRLKINSMPQLFEARFNSRPMKLFASLIIFFFLIPYSASVYKGLTSVCSILLGIDTEVCLVIIAVASAVIVVLGGYLATLKADAFQGLLMMAGVLALIIAVIRSSQVGGLSHGFNAMWEEMKKTTPDLTKPGRDTIIGLLSMVLMTSFGTWGLPQMIHKYYGVKDEKQIKRGTVVSTIFALLVAGGGYFIGSFARLFFSELPKNPATGTPDTDFLIPNMLRMANISSVLIGLMLVLLIAASVSTLSALALTACSTATSDFVKETINKKMSDKSTLLMTRIFCLAFILLSYLLAHSTTGIVDLMSYSWGIISGSFLAPYLLSLYWKGMNKVGGWVGVLGGFIVGMIPVVYCVILGNKPGPILNGPVFAVAAMVLSFAFCALGTALSRKTDKDTQASAHFYEGVAQE